MTPFNLATAFLLLILPIFGADPVAARTPRDIFIFAGQSNMAGADAVIPDPPGSQRLRNPDAY